MRSIRYQRGWAWLSWAVPAAAKLAQGLLGDRAQEKATEANINMQREFAQKGIQWKVEDAKAAGIHPLYALGASTHSFSPVQVGNPLGDALGDMGQELGRAFNAQASNAERQRQAAEYAGQAAERLQMDRERHRSQLLNDEVQRQYWASRIASANQVGNPPGSVGDAGGAIAYPVGDRRENVVGVKIEPDTVTKMKPGGYETAGTHGAFKEYRYGTKPNETMRLPSSELGEALENMGVGKYPALFEMYRGLWAEELRKKGYLPGEPPDSRPGWRYYIGKGWRRPQDHR